MNEKFEDYTILLATDPSSLTSQVLKLKPLGWVPQGGVAIAAVRNEDKKEELTQWAQAMIKRSDA